MIETVNRVLAVAFLAAGVGLLTGDAYAAPRAQAELINWPTNPFVCLTDEGYDRWTACDGCHHAKGKSSPLPFANLI
jgi:hypothetical protein